MQRVLRIILMWVITLAVPVQAMAAASMIGCGPGHMATMRGMEHSAASAYPTATLPHQHSEQTTHLHANAPGHSAQGHEGHTHSGKGACSACSSCCMSAAMPAQLLTLTTQAPVVFRAPTTFCSVAAFLTDGPERPPRSFLV